MGHQGNIFSLYVSNLGLCFCAYAAFLVDNSVANSIEKLILRPGKVRMLIFFDNCLIRCIIPQVCIRAVIGLTAGQREHIRQSAIAPVVCEMGKLLKNTEGIVILFFYIALIGFIRQQILRYGIVGRTVRLGEHILIGIVTVLKFGKFFIHIPDIRIRLIQCILYQLLILRIGCQVFTGRGIESAVRFGKFSPDTFVCDKQGKILPNLGGISRFFTVWQRLIGHIVRQIRFSAFVSRA